MKSSNYEPANYSSKFTLGLHYFWGGHVWVSHQYETKDTGFKEWVSLDLRLVDGKWKALNVYIAP